MCVTCLDDFLLWRSFIDANKEQDIEFLFVIRAPEEYFFESIAPYFPIWEVNYAVCLDPDNLFGRSNEELLQGKSSSYLIDQSGQVILRGSPVASVQSQRLYEMRITY